MYLVNLFIYDYLLKGLYCLLQIFVLIVNRGWPRPLLTYYEVDIFQAHHHKGSKAKSSTKQRQIECMDFLGNIYLSQKNWFQTTEFFIVLE